MFINSLYAVHNFVGTSTFYQRHFWGGKTRWMSDYVSQLTSFFTFNHFDWHVVRDI